MNKEREKRKTAGQISLELSQKKPESITYEEQAARNMKNYEDNVLLCVEKGKEVHKDDFYVVVINKFEPLLRNISRNYFAHLVDCPTPDYDQTVFKYHKKDDHLEFLWTIPTRVICLYLKENALILESDLDKESLKHVLNFSDGTYYTLCKKLNNEKKDSCFKEIR